MLVNQSESLKLELKSTVRLLEKTTTLLNLHNIHRETDVVQVQSIILGIFYLQIKRIIWTISENIIYLEKQTMAPKLVTTAVSGNKIFDMVIKYEVSDGIKFFVLV